MSVKRARLVYQMSSLALTGLQSILYPLAIGVDQFGLAIVLLSPVLFAQAIAEPFFQAVANCEDRPTAALSVRLPALASLFGLGFVLATSSLIGVEYSALESLLVLGTCPLYLFSTAVQSFLISRGAIVEAAVTNLCCVVGYFSAGLILYSLDSLDHKALLWSAFGAFGFSSLVGLVVAKRMYGIDYRKDKVRAGFALGALTFRLPSTLLLAGYTMLLPSFGASLSEIGVFRIVISAINVGRYLNPVPLPVLQVSLSRIVSKGSRRETRRDVVQSCVFTGLFGLALASMFPVLFRLIFIDLDIPRWALFGASLVLLLQPLSYASFLLLDSTSGKGYAVPLAVSGILMICAPLLLSHYAAPLPVFAVSVFVALFVTSLPVLKKAIVRC